ncbi:MAG: hypothetical protein JF611_15030 [Betaproteobacteria bacterium]|nr:hypothetical protein [Betaproteobacteria bacterium]
MRPWSSGRRRITIASGRPTTIAITPEPKAVARQPTVCSDQATSGTEMPPSARPIDIEESARARQRSNQLMSAMLTGKKPHRLEPSAITRNAA